MTGVRNLIASTFGPSADLYRDVLNCSSTATSGQIRKAFLRRALQLHPDKQAAGGDLEKSTRNFQAVSAAYEILRDPVQRATYDNDGGLLGDNEDAVDDDVKGFSSHTSDNKEWEKFFRSIFREMSHADDDNHSANYRGSEQEASDVLKFYKLCRGDLDMVLTCIVHANEVNVKQRWLQTIIEPAIARGNAEIFSKSSKPKKRKLKKQSAGSSFVDINDGDSDSNEKQSNKRLGQTKRKQEPSLSQSKKTTQESLVDTDEDENDQKKTHSNEQMRSQSKAAGCKAFMSKRDKMEYRIAQKQKAKREKDIELASLINGKQWHTRPTAATKRPGTFNDNLLASWESKYSAGSKKATKDRTPVKKKARACR